MRTDGQTGQEARGSVFGAEAGEDNAGTHNEEHRSMHHQSSRGQTGERTDVSGQSRDCSGDAVHWTSRWKNSRVMELKGVCGGLDPGVRYDRHPAFVSGVDPEPGDVARGTAESGTRKLELFPQGL